MRVPSGVTGAATAGSNSVLGLATLGFQPHLRQPVSQSVARKAQRACGLALIPFGALERLADEFLFVLIERHARRQGKFSGRTPWSGRVIQLDIGRVQPSAGTHDDTALDNIL